MSIKSKTGEKLGLFTVGDTMYSSYSSLRHTIKVIRFCKCKITDLDTGKEKTTIPHYHLQCTDQRDGHKSYFNYLYDCDGRIFSLGLKDEYFLEGKTPAAPPELAKRGRKKGSGNRTAQLNVRVQPELLQLIEHMRESEIFKNYSVSDVLHYCISGDAAFMLSSGVIKRDPEIEKLINRIKS